MRSERVRRRISQRRKQCARKPFWFGILARAGTPKAFIDKLSIEIGRIMALPEMKEKLTSQAVEPFTSTPEQFAALMKADTAKYAGIIKTANIKIE